MSTLSRIENATWFYSHRLKLSTSNGSFSKRSSKNKFDQNTGIAFLVWTENILKKELFKKVDANIRISVYSVRGDELLLRPVISYFRSIRFSSIFQHSRWDNSVKKAWKTWFVKQWYIWVSMVDLVKSDSGTEFASNGVCIITLQKV